MTHIAGNDVTIDGRFLRQRCSWCGGILVDYDLENVAVASDLPSPPRPSTWPVGALVRIQGQVATVVNRMPAGAALRMPDDGCTQLDHEVTA